MTKIRIIKRYDDFDDIVLGHIETDLPRKQAERLIDIAWDFFQANEPDTDAGFVNFLAHCHNAFKVIESDFDDHVIY
mgnify:CR=1 FL=1